jgi:spermidine synthase
VSDMLRDRQPRGVAPAQPRGERVPIATGSVVLRDETDGSTTVLVNGVASSSLRADPAHLDFEYMRHAAAAIALWGPPARMVVLHVGGAACTFPRYLAHQYPDSRHLVVEVDPVLARLAREWGDLPRAPRLRIRVGDGLEVLRSRPDASVDIVVRDAFAGDATPAHLADEAWWREVRRVVRPGGLAIANVAAVPRSDDGRRDARFAGRAFATVCAVGEPAALAGTRVGNATIVAGDALDLDGQRRYAASAPLPTVVRVDWGT